MDTQLIVKQFKAIGAQLIVREADRLAPGPIVVMPRGPRRPLARTYDLNILPHGRSEQFVLTVTRNTPPLNVLQANKAARHLLLHVTGELGGERFLCGHDERHWFVAAVEGRVSTIIEAKRELLPVAMRGLGLTPKQLARRHTTAFRRQGEWFFVPTDKVFTESLRLKIYRNEPLVRGPNNKPHVAGELVRFGGVPVVLWRGTEYTPEAFGAMVAAAPNKFHGARPMVKDPETYVRGPIRHTDHETLTLDFWHRVYPNNEARSKNLSFYD